MVWTTVSRFSDGLVLTPKEGIPETNFVSRRRFLLDYKDPITAVELVQSWFVGHLDELHNLPLP